MPDILCEEIGDPRCVEARLSARRITHPTAHVPGKHLTVLMDPANPKKYWVDTGSLPAKAG